MRALLLALPVIPYTGSMKKPPTAIGTATDQPPPWFCSAIPVILSLTDLAYV